MYYFYESFDWESYVLQNNDLSKNITKKNDAWDHWMNHGQYENRIITLKKNDDTMIHMINEYILKYEEPFIFLKLNEELKKSFDWVIYLSCNSDLFISRNITNEKDVVYHWNQFGKMEKRKNYDINHYNPLLKREFLLFDWNVYININNDLKNIDSEEMALKHWLNYGIKEERATYRINTSKIHNGRFGNLFFVNMVCHFLSFKYDLIFNYKYYNKFKKLGINLFIGRKTYKKNMVLTDVNFYDILRETKYEKTNIIITNDLWFQSSILCNYLRYYFANDKVRNNICNNNIFKDRYEKNDDLFVHLRLGDVINRIEESRIACYYEETIKRIKFEKGFISSDSIDHPLCQNLIHKYGFMAINNDEIKTIMFASTCKHIILSGGTYSWLIGFFAFFSENIYYPRIINKWYGDIFIFPDWKPIDL